MNSEPPRSGASGNESFSSTTDARPIWLRPSGLTRAKEARPIELSNASVGCPPKISRTSSISCERSSHLRWAPRASICCWGRCSGIRPATLEVARLDRLMVSRSHYAHCSQPKNLSTPARRREIQTGKVRCRGIRRLRANQGPHRFGRNFGQAESNPNTGEFVSATSCLPVIQAEANWCRRPGTVARG